MGLHECCCNTNADLKGILDSDVPKKLTPSKAVLNLQDYFVKNSQNLNSSIIKFETSSFSLGSKARPTCPPPENGIKTTKCFNFKGGLW